MFASFFVVIAGLCCCRTANSEPFLGQPQLYGPSEAKAGESIELYCELLSYPQNETVQVELYKQGNRDKLLAHYTLVGAVGTFPLKVKPQYEGNLECLATLQNINNTRSVEGTVSDAHYLKVVVPVKGAKVEVVTESVEFFEGKLLILSCELDAGNYVSYKWFLNDQQVPFHSQELRNHRTTSEDSGSYRCEATNQFNNTFFTSSSSEFNITVKDVLSEPQVSFVVLKEGSNDYAAVVTCQTTKGATPITFSLHNSTGQIGNKTTEDRNATFEVPIVLGRHMGWLQCQADNGDRPVHSRWLPLEVVPVGGPVHIQYDYYTGDDYAVIHLTFYCTAEKGSHPRYEWFLNNTLLRGRGGFFDAVDQPSGKSMLMLAVDGRSAGTYRCEASDSFDNGTRISSKRQYMDREVLNRLPVLVVAVVFGCFIFLIALVSACCGFGVVYRRRVFGDNSLSGLEMKKNAVLYEGELDLLESSEDEDLGSSRQEVDQISEASVNEWLLMIEEKKTLEDGPIEFP